jgi:membrane associated rhomboid family serine protease
VIPLRDSQRSRTFPWVNYALIAANAAVFFHELSLGPLLEDFIRWYGFIPKRLAHPDAHVLATVFTSMFMHGGWMHLISNCWCLFIFGDNIEDSLGHGKFLLFYLTSGIAAVAAQAWAAPGSPYPMIGASGAIAGVMGAYIALYPGARVLTLLPLFFFFRVIELPASIFLGFWFFSQLYSGTLALAHSGRLGGVAWWAHIGGFIGGIILLGPFLLRGRRRGA